MDFSGGHRSSHLWEMARQAKNRYLLAAIAFTILSFSVYLCWAVILPFDAAPDEGMRYQIPQFIYHYGTLPHGGDPLIRNAAWGISYGFTPILSYMIGALFMRITGIFTTDAAALLLSARLVSVLCNTGTVIICFLIAGRLFKGLYRWLFVCFVAFLPQFMFIGAYVNNDSLAIFSTAMIVYAWIRNLSSRWAWPDCVLLAVGVSLCALSYYNAYGFILCSILLYLGDRYQAYRALHCAANSLPAREFWRETGRRAGLMVGIVLLLAGWWFIRNAIIYQGDILGMRTSDYYGELYGVGGCKPSLSNSAYHMHWSLWRLLITEHWLQNSYKSFIGCFGYMNIWLDKRIYLFFTILWSLAITGLLSLALSHKDRRPFISVSRQGLFTGIMLLALPIPFALSLYYTFFCNLQPQGRYLLPMVIPMMVFITRGAQQLIDRLFPKRWIQTTIQLAICSVAFAVVVYCYIGILLPKYVY
ncbi:MAG: hypothetical protein VB070_02880 [Clostridiaceae bacterium]|nr:hypothetical protein [Clostridiaceae bacterium]